jgi:pullulanase/glycogen debranching enzyme
MVAVTDSPIREGLPHPLGATWDGKGVNFALFSAHATLLHGSAAGRSQPSASTFI